MPLTILVTEAEEAVAGHVGVRPDMTPETLPLLDVYLHGSGEEVPRDERNQLLARIGGYFGEVIRNQLGGEWQCASPDPAEWRLEVGSGEFSFSPMGMAAEVLYGCETEGYDGTLTARDDLQDALAEILAAAPPIPREVYYSLAGRWEVISALADWLLAHSTAPHPCTCGGHGHNGQPD